MSLETKPALFDPDLQKPGLIFDADNISLTGKFTDEISAYRARRQWIEVVQNYFLLEAKRDYDMSIQTTAENIYILSCNFHSACGRYAFWRLVNNQAPEAEAKLYSANMVNRKSARFLLGSFWPTAENGPWVYSGKGEIEGDAPKRSILDSIRRLFD